MSGRDAARPVIAIDGPAGSGKSTLGRGLAGALGLAYVNTGLMYRAVTVRALERGVDPDDSETIADLARGLRFELDASEAPARLQIEGRDPGEELLTPEVEATVSRIARHPRVRRVLVAEQRRLGSGGAVVEGRDIGTVVFPDADVKLFLDVDPAVRAARRAAERDATGQERELANALHRRDELDARTNPLEAADDAVVLDNEGRTPEEVLEEALAIVRARLDG